MKKIFLPIFWVAFFQVATAQTPCAPQGAKICVSGDDTTQVWVNGSYLGSKDYCDLKTGCNPAQLCFEVPMFLIPGPSVCLAIKTDNKNPVRVFSSWELEVDCARAKPFIVDNDDLSKNGITLYWDPKGGASCGPGASPSPDADGRAWTDPNYSPLTPFFNRKGAIVTATTWTAAHLKNAMTGEEIPYISYDADAEGSGPTTGCGVLYWRQVAKLPPWVPTSTPTAVYSPTWTLTTTSTFTPRPFPTATWTPRPIPTLKPSPWPKPRPRSLPTPAPTPRMRYVPSPQVRRYKLRPTATFVYRRPTPTPTMIPFHMPVYVPSPTPSKPTPVPTWLPKLDKIHTIVYQTPPVEIYVTFADGPGRYQLEMTDGQGNPLRMVFDKKVVADSESWVTWDGKDDQGHEMPPGQYFVIFYKNGKALRSISVIRSGSR